MGADGRALVKVVSAAVASARVERARGDFILRRWLWMWSELRDAPGVVNERMLYADPLLCMRPALKTVAKKTIRDREARSTMV